MSTNSAGITPALQPPHGIEQIIATFGDIYAYIRPDHALNPSWEAEFLDRMACHSRCRSHGTRRSASVRSDATSCWFQLLPTYSRKSKSWDCSQPSPALAGVSHFVLSAP